MRVGKLGKIAVHIAWSMCSVLGGCSSPSDASGSQSGAPPAASALLASLSVSQQASVCDSVAAGQGGYNTLLSASCPNGSTVSMPGVLSQAACIEGFSTLTSNCTATAGDFENCQGTYVQWLCDCGASGSTTACPASCLAVETCVP